MANSWRRPVQSKLISVFISPSRCLMGFLSRTRVNEHHSNTRGANRLIGEFQFSEVGAKRCFDSRRVWRFALVLPQRQHEIIHCFVDLLEQIGMRLLKRHVASIVLAFIPYSLQAMGKLSGGCD